MAAALLLTVAVYWPGLKGPFVFDDYPNIVNNEAVHLEHSTARGWINAALSSPSSELRRPLSSISFAANWLTTGAAAAPMKITNLVLHLMNGTLIFFLIRRLLFVELLRQPSQIVSSLLPTAVAATWLLLPINLPAVLYVVQRMESLSQLCVLAGLYGYISIRLKMQRSDNQIRNSKFAAFAFIVIAAATVIGMLCKESAALLPVYAFIIEVALFRFKNSEKTRDKKIVALFVATLFVPLFCGCFWLWPRVTGIDAWADRPFTLSQRLLTEPRVLLDYIQWTFFPDPRVLSLYHDDIPQSTSLFDPVSTASSIVLLLCFFLFGWLQRTKRPLLFVGIMWFFAAHMLTATIIPLELVFEHRNYFASVGLLLALFSVLLPGEGTALLPIARTVLAIALVVVSTGVTILRSYSWSNPVQLALTDANNHPRSVRANYDAARVLALAADYKPSPLLDAADVYLRRAESIPGSSILPEQALIVFAERSGLIQQEDELWSSMYSKLQKKRPLAQDTLALESLMDCQLRGDCHFDPGKLRKALDEALLHPNPSARFLAANAVFARSIEGNDSIATQFLEKAVTKAPFEPAYREDLAIFYAADGDFDRARDQLLALKNLNRFGYLDTKIWAIEKLLVNH